MKLIDMDAFQLEQKLNGKKLVCFGAGIALQNFIKYFESFEFEKKIEAVIDNDVKKQGKIVGVNGKSIPCISLQCFIMKYAVREYIILITCSDAAPICEQLQLLEQLREVECCVGAFVRSTTCEMEEKSRIYPSNYRRCDEQIIPKIIHYCWFGGGAIPEKNLRWMDSWKTLCPDYEIVCWDEHNYDVKKNPYMYEAYKAGRWGFVPDYARLDIIHQYGGIYLDTDVELIAGMDELLYQPAFAGVDNSHRVSLGLGFGAVKGCGIIGDLKEMYSTLKFKKEDGSLNLVAAPTLQDGLFKKKGFVANGEYQIVDDMTIYPEKVLSAKCNITGRILPTKHSISIHHYDGSWNAIEKRNKIKDMQDLYKGITCR